MIREYIPALLENHDLTPDQAEAAMIDIMTGQATPSQISAFLIGLKKKGETVDEITAIARVMRTFSRTVCPKVDGYLLDTCVGVKLEMEPALVEKAIEEIGIGFMFAPNFHPAMKNVASIRREIGVRTVFNILGPLTNPAGPNAQLIGVYDSGLLEPMCVAAHNLGAKSVMTVHGRDDPRVQIVAANAAAGLVLCEASEDMRTGVELALNAVENGRGLRILRQLIVLSGGNPERLEVMA